MNKTSKKFKDPGSAFTHLIAIICAFPLIGKAVHTNNSIVVFAMSVFISSMILLYGASTLYHSLDISKKVNLFFRRIDHSMIFVLIAGSYTPVCLLALDKKQGIPLLILVWSVRNGSLLCCISEWAGHVYLSSSHSLPICQPVHLHGSLPEASSTLSAVLSTD